MSIDLNNSKAIGDKTSKRCECDHCDLPVPQGLIVEGDARQFCCQGCRFAFELISSSGLSAYYRMAGNEVRVGGNGDDVQGDDAFRELDEVSFYESFVVVDDVGMGKTEFSLEGIHCAACVWLLEKLPSIAPGVVSTTVSWARSTISVKWNTNLIQLSTIAKRLNQLGYKPHAIRENTRRANRNNENRRQLAAIGLAAAAAGNNMMIAAALYYGMFNHMTAGFEGLLRWTSCVVGVLAVAFPGRVFLRGGWNALKTRTAHMDLPISLGLFVGTTAGLINTFRGVGEIYFDSLSILVFLLLVGRWIQFRQQNNAADAVEMLYRMTPKYAWKVVEGNVSKVSLDKINVGDNLEIRPGDVVPVDAKVVKGSSSIDESILTGESNPVRKSIGASVAAGTQNMESVLLVRAVAVGKETRLSRIVSLIADATADKPKVVEWANRIGAYFVIAIIAAATVTFFAWLSAGPNVAVNRAVALLIVACPCALALATPLAISVALGRAAQNKIMIKDGDVFQRLHRPGTIWLDKTGTLTEGKLQMIRWHGSKEVMPLVAALESKSSHPVGLAIAGAISSDLVSTGKIEQLLSVSNGISGIVNGQSIAIGDIEFVRSRGVVINSDWNAVINSAAEEFCSHVLVVQDNNLVAVALVSDRLRADSDEVIQWLKNRGWEVGLLSGDNQSIADRIGRELGLDPEMVIGGVQPEDKVAVINDSLSRQQTVVMVGDGVNDSAALGAASIGIAVRNGAESSLAAAPVYLAKNGLLPIKQLLELSDSTNHVIRTNLIISIAYNMVGAALAASGMINPLTAAILMPISSLTVVAISLTAGRRSKQVSPSNGVVK